MPRKKLSAKKETKTKTSSLVKKLKSKISGSELSLLMDLDAPIFASDDIVTDDNLVALIVPNAHDFILENKSDADIVVDLCEINTIDLQMDFDRNKKLKPELIDDSYLFDSIGHITKNQYDWFTKHYPLSAFYPITKWFGKDVNTLVIVLAEEHGKPVGILKTTE